MVSAGYFCGENTIMNKCINYIYSLVLTFDSGYHVLRFLLLLHSRMVILKIVVNVVKIKLFITV